MKYKSVLVIFIMQEDPGIAHYCVILWVIHIQTNSDSIRIAGEGLPLKFVKKKKKKKVEGGGEIKTINLC